MTLLISDQESTEHVGMSSIDVVRHWARTVPNQPALIHLPDGENTGIELNYLQLSQRVDALASQLLLFARPGECVLLCLVNEVEYLTSMLACFRVGIIAIPSLTPNNERSIKRIQTHLLDSGASVVLLDSGAAHQLRLRESSNELSNVVCLKVEELRESAGGADLDREPIADTEVAYLQYTSGSTMNPRGVMITRGNLASQQGMLKQMLKQDLQSTTVNWMPLHHDFGLVMSLQALHVGGCCVLLPPLRVVQKPVRWLRAIDRFRATLSAGATFMFDLCARKITTDECTGLKLSHWKNAIIAAEPIQASIIQRFSAMFGSYGFGEDSFCPGYGMAESTLMISIRDGFPVLRRFDSKALQNGKVQVNEDGQYMVGSGKICFPNSVFVVDPKTNKSCNFDEIGEIWTSNPSVGKGYWRQTESTQTTFNARLATGTSADQGGRPYLRTGDLGFIHEDELFIAGRIKDTIIINGENRYPQDIEWTVNHCHQALEPGAGVALGIDIDGTERLAVVYEVRRTARSGLNVDEVLRAIRSAVVKAHDIDVHRVVLLQPASLPKTSSGKVQRQACKRQLQANELAVISAWRLSPDKPSTDESVEAGELLALCRRVLNDSSIGLDADLMAHGADSLLSAEIIGEVESRWHCSIDLAAFAKRPTVRCLLGFMRPTDIDKNAAVGKSSQVDDRAEQVAEVPQPSLSPLMGVLTPRQLQNLMAYTVAWHGEWVSPRRLIFGLNTSGRRPPLFWCFQGEQEFLQLAKYLGADQPLYGMRSGHLVLDYADPTQMNTLAGLYLDEMVNTLPQQEYYLGGNCQAGVVASRMAQMLAGVGREVRGLFVLENIVPRLKPETLPFPISMFYGRQSTEINPYHRFPMPSHAWDRMYPMGYSIDIINGAHGQFFAEPNIVDFANKLSARLASARDRKSARTLPATAFVASFSVVVDGHFQSGGTASCHVQVTNSSAETWVARDNAGLILANHWFDEGGKCVQWLDGYVPITQDILPSAAVLLALPISAPSQPGTYILEIDMAEQGVAWFGDKGNKTYRQEVVVHAAPV